MTVSMEAPHSGKASF